MRLLTRSDIARHCDVTTEAIDKWRQRYPDFPAPVRRFGQSPVWDRDEIQLWCEKRGREFA